MSYTLSIDRNVIKSTNTVKLFGVNVDHKLRFDFHISKLCLKAAMQLNALRIWAKKKKKQ